MKSDRIKLIREQTAEKLTGIQQLFNLKVPIQGWIKSIRKSLGMNTRQLSEKLQVKRQRISELEKEEINGNLTIKTLRRAAEAMNCTFVYALVPITTLEDTVKNQAETIVKERMKRTSHTMSLEQQGLNTEQENKAFTTAVEKILRDSPESIWDKK